MTEDSNPHLKPFLINSMSQNIYNGKIFSEFLDIVLNYTENLMVEILQVWSKKIQNIFPSGTSAVGNDYCQIFSNAQTHRK